MFKTITNQEYEKKIEINPMKEMLLKSKVELGNTELYKNDWLTNNKIDYIEKNLSNNRYSTKGIPHLIPNNSTVELIGEKDKRPYLTSFKRDYIDLPYSKNELNKDVRDMIKNSKIVVRIYHLSFSSVLINQRLNHVFSMTIYLQVIKKLGLNLILNLHINLEIFQ